MVASLARPSSVLCDHSLIPSKTGITAGSVAGTPTTCLMSITFVSIKPADGIGLARIGNSPLPSPTITVRGVALGPYVSTLLGIMLKTSVNEG